MKTLKMMLLVIGTALMFAASTAPVVKVLQNGLDNYNGCTDAFVFSKAGYESTAYGTHDSLKIYWTAG